MKRCGPGGAVGHEGDAVARVDHVVEPVDRVVAEDAFDVVVGELQACCDVGGALTNFGDLEMELVRVAAFGAQRGQHAEYPDLDPRSDRSYAVEPQQQPHDRVRFVRGRDHDPRSQERVALTHVALQVAHHVDVVGEPRRETVRGGEAREPRRAHERRVGQWRVQTSTISALTSARSTASTMTSASPTSASEVLGGHRTR